jgi:hypothetical protein
MLTVLAIAAACGAARALFAALLAWRQVPRSNDDLVFF